MTAEADCQLTGLGLAGSGIDCSNAQHQLGNDVSHQVGNHPADLPCIHISDLKDVVVLRFPGTSSAVDDMSHLPVLVLRFTR